MANTFQSSLIKAQEAARTVSISQGLINGDDLTGTLLVATAKWDGTDGTLTNNNGDTIILADIPAGSVLVPQLCSVAISSPANSSVKMNVGVSGNTSQYADSIVASVATGKSFGTVPFTSSASATSAAVSPIRFTSPTRIIATVSEVIGTTSATSLTFTLVYRAKA
jgi:hypothetical protein